MHVHVHVHVGVANLSVGTGEGAVTMETPRDPTVDNEEGRAAPLSLTTKLKGQEMEPDGIGGLTPSEAEEVGLVY